MVSAALVPGIRQWKVLLHFATCLPKTKGQDRSVKHSRNPISVRAVIQQLGLYPVLNYRFIVYGDNLKPMHRDFASAVVLLEALRAVAPELDVSNLLLTPLREDQGSIVFDGELLLRREQLAALACK